MQALIQLLHQKSQEFNLFSAGDKDKLESKHFPDALAVLNVWALPPKSLVLDLGTGGGLPGLALASALPENEFVLLDARAKKIEALQEIAGQLSMENVQAASGRFEVLAHEKKWREQFDAVVARAVAPLPTLLEYAAGFLKVNGVFYAWKSRDYAEELAQSQKAQKLLHLKFQSVYDYALPTGELRSILTFIKLDPLERLYPRSDGVPKHRPL